MGFGSFAGGLATGWATASKMIGEDEDRAERKKSAELEREGRRLLLDETRREQSRRQQRDDVATTISKGGKEQTSYSNETGTYGNEADAEAKASNAREFDDMASEYALENPQSTVAPLYSPSGLKTAKTTSMYSRSKALDDATTQAAGNAEALEAIEAKRKLYKAEGMNEAIAELRRTGDMAAAGKVFDQYGDVRLPKEVLGGKYDSKTDSVTLANGNVIPLKRFELDTIGVKDREDLRIKEIGAQGRVENGADANMVRLMTALGLKGGLGGSSGGKGSGGKGVSENGVKYATHDDFAKANTDPNTGKQESERTDHAFLTYQQLLASNPKMKESAPGEAAARFLANQYANGKIQATPEIGADGRWGFYVTGNAGNKYLLDRPETGIDPQSLKGADGKPRMDQASVDKAEGDFMQSVAKRSPQYFSDVATSAADPQKWTNVLNTYSAARDGKINVSAQDMNELRSRVALGEIVRRHAGKQKVEQGTGGATASAPAYTDQQLMDAKSRGIAPPKPSASPIEIASAAAGDVKNAVSTARKGFNAEYFDKGINLWRGGRRDWQVASTIYTAAKGNPDVLAELTPQERNDIAIAAGKPMF